MSAHDDGGPAFPQAPPPGCAEWAGSYGLGGMSLRDYFAGQCMGSMIHQSSIGDGSWDPIAVAVGCYQMADAMIDERSERAGGIATLLAVAAAAERLLGSMTLKDGTSVPPTLGAVEDLTRALATARKEGRLP